MTATLPRSGLHCIGNGQVAAYSDGPAVRQLFGPVYSTPSLLSLAPADDDLPAWTPHRIVGTCFWKTLFRDGGEITDFALADGPAFLRSLSLRSPLRLSLSSPFLHARDPFGRSPSFLFRAPAGSRIFAACSTTADAYGLLALSPNVAVEGDVLTFPAGHSWLVFATGETLAACTRLAERLAPADEQLPETLLDAALAREAGLRAAMRDFRPAFERHTARRPEPEISADILTETVDDVVAALLSQRSADGGELAGHCFHLAYGRDMYGVFRGFLALGLNEQARAVPEFFLRNWQCKGFLPNACGMGAECAHCHENDGVEQTGYVLQEFVDYTRATGDGSLVRSGLPFLRFLLDAQEANLFAGMLPFNGDETYIAGGLLPRNCIDHGSMEATALYITAGTRFLDLARELALLPPEEIARRNAPLEAARGLFNTNFLLPDGRLRANNPARLASLGTANLPEFRHGVCLHCHAIDDLRRTPDGGFLCAKCHGRPEAEASARPGSETHILDAATLMTAFVAATPVAPATQRAAALSAWQAHASGHCRAKQTGYETGLQLYTLAAPGCEPSSLDTLLGTLLSLRTSAGVWAEFYADGQVAPGCCAYRPWESAINLCAILRHTTKS